MRSRTEGARAWLLLCTGMSVATLLAGQSVMGSVVGQPLHVDGRETLDAPIVLEGRPVARSVAAAPAPTTSAPSGPSDAGRALRERLLPLEVGGGVRTQTAPGPRDPSPAAWRWDFDGRIDGWSSGHLTRMPFVRVGHAGAAWVQRPSAGGGQHLVPVRDDATAVPEGEAHLASPDLAIERHVEVVLVRFRYAWHPSGVTAASVLLDWPGRRNTTWRQLDLEPTGTGWEQVEWQVPVRDLVETLRLSFTVTFDNGLASGDCRTASGLDDDHCELDFWLDDVEVELL